MMGEEVPHHYSGHHNEHSYNSNAEDAPAANPIAYAPISDTKMAGSDELDYDMDDEEGSASFDED